MKPKKKNIITIYILLAGAIGIIGGVMIGMIFQQMIFTASMVEVGESLEGVTVNVDLNETVLVDKFTEIFIPIFNQTIQENNKK